MTVVNGIESTEVRSRKDDIKAAIANNAKIEDKLNVIMVVSNACKFHKRWQLAREFTERMLANPDVVLYTVELAYGDEAHRVTDAGNPRHLQLRTPVPLWHKENCIDIGVRKLLPPDWKAFAWVDADIEFMSPTWASDTLKILNGAKDIVQPFSHCIDMDAQGRPMSLFCSFGFQYETTKRYVKSGPSFWHPGWACAMTRQHYEKVGVFQHAILGAGDNHMMQAIIGQTGANPGIHPEYARMLEEYMSRVVDVRLGYVPCVIRHYFHGSKKNRRYMERWKILVKHQYNPYTDVALDDQGVLVPTDACPRELLRDILGYFEERKEDEE